MTDWQGWGEEILDKAEPKATPINMDCDIVISLENLSLGGELAKQWEVVEFSWLLDAGQGGSGEVNLQHYEIDNGDRERTRNFEVGEETMEHDWLDDLVHSLNSLDTGQADLDGYEEILSSYPSLINRDWLKVMVRDIKSVPEMVVIVDKSPTEIDTHGNNIVSHDSGDELETVAMDLLDGERDLDNMLQEQPVNIKPKEQALDGEINCMTNDLFVGTCSQPSVAMDYGGGGMVMEQVQDKSGQVARLDVKSKSSYEQKEWLPPEAMVAEECLVREEVEMLNNLPMELEEI